MREYGVSKGICTLCGGTLPQSMDTGVCTECADAVGSVNIVPAATIPVDAAGGGADNGANAPLRLASFGDYEILNELAHGGMGIVYIARQLSLNRRVALKMILTPFASDIQKRRFQVEAEHAATLEHPNIVPVYDSGNVDGMPYFTMKLIEGQSFSAEIRRSKSEPRKAVAILAEVARAVHYAHQRGILHRDLKPANILLDNKGTAYVGDFGLSKRFQSDGETPAVEPKLTREGAAMGTPYYMSPEQACGDSSAITTAADVYGLGAILYEMLTLRAPFQDSAPWEILHNVKTEDPVPPRKLRASADRDLEIICLKCLEKDPARRYISAEALACELERWLRGEPILARGHSPLERSIKWARRNPAIASSAALGTVLILTIAGFYWHSFELVKQADLRKIEERRAAAKVAVDDGNRALITARTAEAENHLAASESALIEAEDRFREALFNQRGDAAAERGLRETALMSFDAALRTRNWAHAREKLLLARGAHLAVTEFERKQAQLKQLESERADLVRTRVKFLMDDAVSVTRSVPHELAVYELIALKDETSVALIAGYVRHERAECRMLACAALAWIGDASLVTDLLPYIQAKTPSGKDNPVGVQEAAITAICKLAADDDLAAYTAVWQRIDKIPGQTTSLLFYRVKIHFDEFARRLAKNTPAAENDSSDKLFERAQLFSDSGSYREALPLYDRLVVMMPGNRAVFNQRGLARLNLGDSSRALADFNVVIALKPDRNGYCNRGLAKLDLNDVDGALSDFDKAVEFDPNEPSLLATRGSAKVRKGDIAGAMDDYNRALKLDPENLYALTNRALAHAHENNLAEALKDYDRALSLSPLFKQALTGRACARMVRGDFDGALEDFDKSLALDPNQAGAFYNRAILKSKKSDLSAAIRDFDRSIALDPGKAVAYFNRAIAKSKSGDKSGAASDYEKAIELAPDRVESMVNLGLLRESAGKKEAALELYNRALSINPRKFEALNNRANLLFKLGRATDAAKDMQAALAVLPTDWSQEARADFEKRRTEYEAKASGK